MRCVALIQCRLGSTRLPGKVLKEINGMPLVVHIYRRLLACKELDSVVISWGTVNRETAERELEGTLGKYALYSWSSPNQNDLIQRHLGASALVMADAFVRITGDCLFHDPSQIDAMVADYRKHYPKYRGLTNWGHGRIVSEGLDAEIYSTELLAELDRDPKCPREDFATYAASNGYACQWGWTPYVSQYSAVNEHLSIDTQEDFDRAEKMLKILGNDEWRYEKTLEAYRQVTGVS